MADHAPILLPSDNDVPINRTTSFNGVLNKYMHVSETKRAPEILDIATPPKRRRGLGSTPTPTTPTSDESTTHRTIITRSQSRSSTTTPSAPASPSQTPTPPRSLSRRRPKSTPSTPSPRSQSHSQSPTNLLEDTIPPNLTLLLVGVNPGIMTGTTGFAYAHPSNLFWKLLHSSGITPIRHPPSDTYRLPSLYNIGNTNIVTRPTRDASMLSRAEMDAGVPVLEAKIAAKRPQAVCLVGKSIWEAVWRVKKGRGIKKEEFRYGWQGVEENLGVGPGWEGARIFVATTTSGLAAGMTMAQKEAVWRELGRWVVQKREESTSISTSAAAVNVDVDVDAAVKVEE